MTKTKPKETVEQNKKVELSDNARHSTNTHSRVTYPCSERVQVFGQRLVDDELYNVTSEEEMLVYWLRAQFETRHVHVSYFNCRHVFIILSSHNMIQHQPC